MAALLPACLDSLLGQEPGYRPREILVIDDGSDDDTRAVVETYRRRSRAIRSWRIRADNANRARLFGVAMSRGAYILLLDADNWLEPDFVRKTLAALHTPDAEGRLPAFAYGDRVMHYEAGWHPGHDPEGSDVERIAPGPFDPDRLKSGNYIDLCSLIRREAVQLDPGLSALQDWDLWLRLAAQNQYGAYVPETAFHYRVHRHNLTRKRIETRDDPHTAKIIRRHGLGPWIGAAARGRSTPPLVSVILIARTEEELEPVRQKLANQDYPRVEICTSTAPGFAAAYQDAMDKAAGDVLVFTETDCEALSPRWLSELVAAVEPDTVVHGLTVTDTTPNMASLALPADVARRFPRNPAYGAAEDTEWILRMQEAGIRYRQLDRAAVIHRRPFIRRAMMDRAYGYGRDWVRLSRRYGYVSVEDLTERAATDREVAERTLQGIRDELQNPTGESPAAKDVESDYDPQT